MLIILNSTVEDQFETPWSLAAGALVFWCLESCGWYCACGTWIAVCPGCIGIVVVSPDVEEDDDDEAMGAQM